MRDLYTKETSIDVQLEERDATVSSHQKACEQMRAERNSYSRDLAAVQAEAAETKRRIDHVVSLVQGICRPILLCVSQMESYSLRHRKRLLSDTR